MGYIVKDHLINERGNLLSPLHGLLFLINSKWSWYAPSHWEDSTYHGLCWTSCGALAGMRNSSMGPPGEIHSMTSLLPTVAVVVFCHNLNSQLGNHTQNTYNKKLLHLNRLIPNYIITPRTQNIRNFSIWIDPIVANK